MKNFFAPFAIAAGLASLVTAVPAAADGPIAKKGEIVGAKLQMTLSSKTNHDGDKFTMMQQDTFFHRNPALKGATIEGHVETVSAATATHKATMSMFFDDIKLADGQTAPLSAKVQSLSAPTHHIRDVGFIVGGAVAGHMMGSKTGVKHGGLAGAGAGLALASSLKSNIVVKEGTVVKLQLNADLVPGSGSM